MALDERRYSETVDAGGRATVEIRVDGQLTEWTLQQITPDMPTAPAGARGELRKDGSLVTPFIATGDPLGGDPPLLLRPGQVVTVEWTSCTPGDVAKVWMSFDDGRGAG